MLGTFTSTQVNPVLLLRKHYAFQQGCFVSEHLQSSGGILSYSEVTPIPMWNHAAWVEDAGGNFAEFLDRGKGWQSQRNRRPAIYLPTPQPEQENALRAAGFEKFDEEAWMVCELDNSQHGRDQNVREVLDHETLDEFISTFCTAFQIKEDGYRAVLKARNEARNENAVRFQHFVLYDERGTATAVGTLASQGRIACAYNVGTPPSERKKGYGRRIFEHIVAMARENGCNLVFLQVENNSAAMRLYEKCGFQTAFVRFGYRLTDWTPNQSKRNSRTKLANLLGYRSTEKGRPQHLRETRLLSPVGVQRLKAAAAEESRNLSLATVAYLLHRYTGEDTATFSLCEQNNSERTAFSVMMNRGDTIQEWTSKLPIQAASSKDDADEVLVCLDSTASPIHLGEHASPLEIHYTLSSGTLEIIYRSDLFSKDSIRRMAAHLSVALDFICCHPRAKVADIELLSAPEKHQLLVEWNQSSFQPVVETIAHLFETRVERTPDANALMLARSGHAEPAEQLTYRQLNRKANRLAHRLQELGVRPDVFVGVCLDRSLEMIVSLLAILKAGGACVPLDPAYPAERLRFMLQDANAPVILTQSHLLPLVQGITHTKVICLNEPAQAANAGKVESEKNPQQHANGDAAAYMIYTSGSTGTPKGVVISNHAIANHSLECCKAYGLSSKDRVLQFSSFNFDAAFEQILPALISGACLVVRDNELWNTLEFANKLRDLQLTVVDIPTAYWHQVATEWSTRPEDVPSNSLRLVIVGGEALSGEKLSLWRKTPLRHVRLINAYGPTETTITATSYEFNAEADDNLEFNVVPIGRPRGDRKAYVLDRFGDPTPIGIPGELHIGGTMLARGYHKRPELTQSRFIQNPFSDEPDARLYRTGDLVRYFEDGTLEFLGRIDDQVKIRGFRIELGEIESTLCKHSGVREGIVLARPDTSGEQRLVAYFIPNAQTLKGTELRAFLKNRLPDYMVPSSFVALDHWPLMPNGKVDRRALPEPAEETLETTVKGPENPLELQLQLLFERVLKRAPIGVDISFFEIGGDSLQALELLVEIEKATGKQLPLGTLYQSSTVQTLAREVQTREGNEKWSSLVPLQVSGKRPAFYLMHTTPGDVLGYGNLIYRLDPAQPCYGFQSIGLKDASLAHTNVTDMAKYYVGLLRQFQPHGPFYLGGWCYGGIVAVEMARLLQQDGEEIGLLALLETVAMPAGWTNFRYHLHRLRCFLRMSPQRWLTYFQAKAKYARESRIANKLRFLPAQAVNGTLPRDERLERLEHVYNTNLAALREYRSYFYNGKITLFNAAERDPALIPDPQYGWVGLAREIEIHDVPGDHDTMLTEPHVSDLAQRLNDCLLRAQNNTKPSQP